MLRWPIADAVELRIPEERHAQDLFDVIERNRERLERWMHWAHHTHSKDDVLAFIRSARGDFRKPDSLHLLIVCRGKISGGCSLILINEKSGEIGYWIDSAEEGKGIVTACCRELIRYGFEETGLNRIQIRCAVGNKRSASIPRRLAFVYEGTLRETIPCGSGLLDAEVYSLLKREYQALKPAAG